MLTRRMFLSDVAVALAAAVLTIGPREYVWTGTGRIEDLERYFQLLIEAGRMPASASPRELVARVYQRAEA